jgi:cyclohexyl-isocyanide hydratase
MNQPNAVTNSKIKILIPIYDDVTQLDFTGPHQFFTRVPETEVIVASMGGRSITVSGLNFGELADLASIESCDVLCVPGGVGCVAMIENQDFLDQIIRLAKTAKYVSSVCTGSIILGAAGLLRGKKAACHWAWRDMLPAFGAIPDDGRVVRDGNIFTGGGVTAGIDFALTLVTELVGAEAAQALQLSLEYAPAPPFDSGRPETAPPHILEAVNTRLQKIMPALRERIERIAISHSNETHEMPTSGG